MWREPSSQAMKWQENDTVLLITRRALFVTTGYDTHTTTVLFHLSTEYDFLIHLVPFPYDYLTVHLRLGSCSPMTPSCNCGEFLFTLPIRPVIF